MSREKDRESRYFQLQGLVFVLLIMMLLPACTAVEAISVAPPAETPGFEEKGELPELETVVMTGLRQGLSYTLLLPRFDIAVIDNAVTAWAEEAVDGALLAHETVTGSEEAANSYLMDYQMLEVHAPLFRLDFFSSCSNGERDPALAADKTLYIDFEEGRVKDLEELVDFDRLSAALRVVFGEKEEILTELNTKEIISSKTVTLEKDNINIDLVQITNNTKNIENELISFSKLGNILRFGSYAQQESELLQKPEAETTPIETEPEEEEPWTPREIDPEKPMIAFTFDDGPSAVTDSVLDLLEEYRIKATFFMIGTQIDSFPQTLVRMHELQSELANHTWDHRTKLPKRNKDAIRQQIQDTIDKIEEVTGQRATLVRPPYGEVDARVKAIAKELGVYLVNWSIDTNDWKHKDVDLTVDEVLKKVRNGSIVLFHDLYEETVEAVSILIPQLLEQGYQFVTVSELFSYSTREILPGEIYRYQ